MGESGVAVPYCLLYCVLRRYWKTDTLFFALQLCCLVALLPAVRCWYYRKSERSGAGEGNRTLVFSLEGYGSTIELHPRETRFEAATTPASGLRTQIPAQVQSASRDREVGSIAGFGKSGHHQPKLP